MSRDHVLHKARTALGRTAGQPCPTPPPPFLEVPEVPEGKRITTFCARLEALSGKPYVASSTEDALRYISTLTAGADTVASNAAYLRECGALDLPGVRTANVDRDKLREACAECHFGLTSANYALADTGSLVMIAGADEQRLISLLPPVHIAIVPRNRLLTGLDELLMLEPDVLERSSSLVFITGPSRTGDIEQFLVRGVHGPGEIHVVIT